MSYWVKDSAVMLVAYMLLHLGKEPPGKHEPDVKQRYP
jgi:hypothetical protein